MKKYTVYNENNEVCFETNDKNEMDYFFMFHQTGNMYMFHEENNLFIMYFENYTIFKKM